MYLQAFMIKKKSLIFSAVFIVIISLILFCPVLNVLSVSSRKLESHRFYSIDGYTKGFVISYTHSVNKGRVHDYYKRTPDNRLILERTVFVSYGAGIPEPGETSGAVFTVLPYGYEISSLNRVLPELVMAVGLIAEHSITFSNKGDFDFDTVLFLKNYFAPQTSIILKIKRISLFDYIKTKKI